MLISHDHYDHLDLAEMRALAIQRGGAPQFFVGSGLGPWFLKNVHVKADEFVWWQSRNDTNLEVTFVPAQHSSGRESWGKNETLWGGWVVRFSGKSLYFAGDTAYVPALFDEMHSRIGRINVAALPIGAYLPRKLMRYEHMNPREALQAHLQLVADQSFGVHWGTFQLGDENPLDARVELLHAERERNISSFGLAAIGSVIEISID